MNVPLTPPWATAPYSPALSPQYGFTPAPRPAWAPYADQVGRVLGDSRMSALMAPGMALVKAPGAAYRAGQTLYGALQAEKVPMTRLYRGESTQKTEVPDWLRQGLKDSGASEAQGRWWTPDKKIADWYAKDAGPGGRRVYQDVPTDVVEQSRILGKPEARYSLDPQNEVFLPKEYAGQGRESLLQRASEMQSRLFRFNHTSGEN